MEFVLRAAVIGGCAVLLTCADALPAAPTHGFACPADMRLAVTGSVEGPQSWLVCCKPKPAGVTSYDAMPMPCGENEVPDGRSLLLFESGRPRVESTYRDGLAQGPVIFWSDAGKVESLGEYARGKMDGTWTYFRASGVAEYRKHYANGVEEGAYERWFENGRLEETSTARAGQTSGPRWVFFESGAIALEELYIGGRLDGLQRHFHEEGRLAREGVWRDGKEEGTFTSWHPNGARASVEHFADGAPVGHATWWSDAGDIVTDGGFQDGKREGAWIEDGWSGSYVANEREGVWTNGAARVVWVHGLEGPLRPCPPNTKEVFACVARCCDARGRWCETPSGERVGPYDAWDTVSGRLHDSNRAKTDPSLRK